MIEGLREVLLKNIDDLIDDDVAEYFKNSLGDSINKINCSECGGNLEHSVYVDDFSDMYIEVEPCKICILEEE